MFVITIQFLTGSYHATPWGKHVNEGIPEWPPSAWRLMRAIIAAWKNTMPEPSYEDVWPILQKLMKDPPRYRLPGATISHTRHYVPTASKKKLIMDTRVVTGDKPVDIIWPDVSLNGKETGVLDSILENLHYFGRAESWCTASTSADTHHHNCVPLGDRDVPEDAEPTYVLVPKHDIGFVDINKQEPGSSDLKHISVTTRKLQDGKYTDPPGARWVQYLRPRNCFEEQPYYTVDSSPKSITLARYAVVGTIRPRIKDTLRVGDCARSACMSIYGKKNRGGTSEVFCGKSAGGKPLTNHEHALYLPTYETQNSEIDHLTIISSRGFDTKELGVLFSLTELRRDGQDIANLVFQGYGTPDDFNSVPILGKARRWISATPLILSRHVKRRGSGANARIVDSPEDQIRSEVRMRYDESYELTRIIPDGSPTNMHNTNIKPIDFFRWRRNGSVGDGRPYNVQLEFKEPVMGPITLGYASHYGLGMFVPAGDDR